MPVQYPKALRLRLLDKVYEDGQVYTVTSLDYNPDVLMVGVRYLETGGTVWYPALTRMAVIPNDSTDPGPGRDSG